MQLEQAIERIKQLEQENKALHKEIHLIKLRRRITPHFLFNSLSVAMGLVMLILKRRVEWWFSMVALHKIGAVAIPATHMLTEKDIMYRCHMVRHCISIGPVVPNGFYDFWRGLHEAAPYKYPRIIEFVDELPKTISGKIRRASLRAM